jgi:hypothetical protein
VTVPDYVLQRALAAVEGEEEEEPLAQVRTQLANVRRYSSAYITSTSSPVSISRRVFLHKVMTSPVERLLEKRGPEQDFQRVGACVTFFLMIYRESHWFIFTQASSATFQIRFIFAFALPRFGWILGVVFPPSIIILRVVLVLYLTYSVAFLCCLPHHIDSNIGLSLF